MTMIVTEAMRVVNCDRCKRQIQVGEEGFFTTLWATVADPICKTCLQTLQAENASKPSNLSMNIIIDAIKRKFPNLSSEYLNVTLSELQLYSDKNHDYAAGGDPYGNFKRVSQLLHAYPNFPYDTPEGVAIIYMLKQLDAVLWNMAQKHDLKVEGLDGRLADIHVYTKIIRCMFLAEKKENE